MERVLVINPIDVDDLDQLNRLFAEGWNSESEYPMGNDEGGLRIYYRLSYCEGCAAQRAEDYDEYDDEDYEEERRRKMEEFERRYPKPPEDNPPF